MRPQSVRIRTGARLHFGPFSFHPDSGRHFGGIGLMIDEPGVELLVRDSASGIDEADSPRALAMLPTIRTRCGATRPVHVSVLEEIPGHSGLGSGTQLALALAEAIALIEGAAPTLSDLAETAGRGLRSAVGIYGYQQGGFLADAGHREGEPVAQLACRIEFPPAWRILLITPHDVQGLHGVAEERTFETLRAMPVATTNALCRLALTEIFPALHAAEFPPFAEAVQEFGRQVGEFFSSSQGGVFASPALRSLSAQLASRGVSGLVQSSWGPTAALFAPSEEEAGRLVREVRNLVDSSLCSLRCVSARNDGRSVLLTPQDE